MYTGTLLADLFEAVERAEKAATPPAQPQIKRAEAGRSRPVLEQYEKETSEAE